MLHWLEHELKVSNNALTKVKAAPHALHAMQPQPSLTVGKANVAALKKVLHMRDAQVRFTSQVRSCPAVLPQCIARQQRIALHVGDALSVFLISILCSVCMYCACDRRCSAFWPQQVW